MAWKLLTPEGEAKAGDWERFIDLTDRND